MATKKCICCGEPVSEHDLLEGYCLVCAGQRVRWYDVLKTNLDVALEPVRHWYGEVKRPLVHIVADVVADLQKDRADVLRLGKQVTQLNHTIAQVRDQRINIAKQLGRAEKNYMKLRAAFAAKAEELANTNAQNTTLLNKAVEDKKDLHAIRSQVVRLAEWCQKKFGIIIGGVIGKGDWPDHICDVVAKVVDDKYQVLGKQIGWYDSNSCTFYNGDKSDGCHKTYTKPVFILKEPDAKSKHQKD